MMKRLLEEEMYNAIDELDETFEVPREFVENMYFVMWEKTGNLMDAFDICYSRLPEIEEIFNYM